MIIMPTWVWKFLISSDKITQDEKNSIIELYHDIGRDEFYKEAKTKKVLPFAANALIEFGLDVQYWTEILNGYRKRNTAILCELDKAYSAVKKHGVKKMFVSENFGALLSASSDIGLFASGDVDNYADSAEKEKIYAAFEEIGYSRKERYSGKHQIAAEFFPPEVKKDLPDGFYISIDFYPLARLKLPCFINADDFVDWTALKTYKGTNVVLPPDDALMYICMLHISLHSFSRAPDIRLYIDLKNASKLDLDYKKIEKWCRRDKTCTRASVAADLSNLLMKTNIPSSIVNLSPRRMKVERLVYDFISDDLKYEPRGIKVLWIEINSCDSGILAGVFEILFPDRTWMKKVYGSSSLRAHLKHFLKVV